jgi:hypothetical protein
LFREADEILRRRPSLGVFPRQAEDLRAQLPTPGCACPGGLGTDRRRASPAAAAVHPPAVPAHRRELFLSRNTVKSQAMSIYRMLGAASYSQAGLPRP